ncbi:MULTISPECIES: sensor histidine kinase [unclassified Kribbella]|uniref:sensor histidine kinase n=1 Tax=unclassified Kribbella TaxID=2644121 RepID=UPI003019F5CE
MAQIRWARAVAVGVTLVALTTAVLGTPGVHRRILEPCDRGICLPFERPTAPSLEVLAALRVSVSAYAAVITVVSWALLLLALGVSLVLVWRRPSLLAVVTAIQLGGLFVGPFADALAEQGDAAVVLRTILIASIQLTLPLLIGLFPDGRWHPRWFRWAWPVVGLIGAGLVVGNQLDYVQPDSAPQGLYDLLSVILLAGIQIHRYVRVSDWTARQQAKWFVLGFVLLAGNVVVANVLSIVDLVEHWQLGLVATAYLAFVAMILGICFALLRYRLYDVSLVLRRTVLYAGAVILLLAAYVGLVALASLSMARASASVVGAAVVAALALAGGLLLARAGGWFRDRLLGPGGRPGGIAALLAHGIAGSDGRPANLAETIAAALVLPYVKVLDADGETLWVHGDPPAEAHRESVVDGSGTTLGALLVASTEGPRLSRRDRRALREVLPFVVLVLRAQREAGELRTARAVATTAREDERRRLRHDLHDGVGPLLAGQLLTVDTLRLAAERGVRPEDLLAHLEGQARAAITEVRRISRDLQPAALDAGLGSALDSEVERFRTAGLDVRLRHQLPVEPMPAAVEVAVLRIVSESLANVVRHAGATSATVDVTVTEDGIEVTVVDDGHGFDDGTAEGVGLVSMRERAEALGGGLEIESGPAGTRVCGRIPL